jgi:hypothetical protein
MMHGSNADRVWMAGGGLAALVVAALAWFFAVSPELSNASSLKSQTLNAQTQNIMLQSKLHKLQADNQQIASLQSSLAAARVALPVDTGLSAFTREIVVSGTQNSVSVISVSAAAPVLAGSKNVAATPGAATMSPAGHLYAIPVTVTVKGAPANELKFLAALQGLGKRAVLVSSGQFSADTTAAANGNSVQLSVQLQIFAAPQSAADMAALQKQLGSTPQ